MTCNIIVCNIHVCQSFYLATKKLIIKVINDIDNNIYKIIVIFELRVVYNNYLCNVKLLNNEKLF